MFCFCSLLTAEAPLLQLPSLLLHPSPSPGLWLIPSTRSNSPLHSLPEHPAQHLTTAFLVGAYFCPWVPASHPPWPRYKSCPPKERLETESARLGSPGLVIKSAVVRNMLLAPQSGIANTYSFRKHFLCSQVPDNSSSARLGYWESPGLADVWVLEIEYILSLGKHDLSSENSSSNFRNTALSETEVCLLFC